MPYLIRFFLSFLFIFHFFIYPMSPVWAFNRILSVPQQPFFISIEQHKYEAGEIRKAFFRTSTELYRLYEMEGLIYRDSFYSLVHADSDNIKDLVWHIELEDPQKGNGLTMWVTTLSTAKLGWVILTPEGETRWNNLPLDIEVPEDIILYVSPTTPEYRGISSYRGNDILSFVYTIAITPDGPALVSVPEIYQQLTKISRMVIVNEADPKLRLVYENICDDYQRMTEGRMPSKEAILNFTWEKILDFEWE